MTQKRTIDLLMAFLFLLLPILLSSCSNLQQSSIPSSSQVESSSQASSEPVPTEKPTVEPSEELSATLSEASNLNTEDGGFDAAFKINPIDTALEEDLANASSSRAILQAYEDAETRWKTMLQISYNAAKNLLDGESSETLQQEQKDWEDKIKSEIDAIRDKNGDDSDGRITSALEIQERYRERTKELCGIVFESSGELPSFDTAMSGEALG